MQSAALRYPILSVNIHSCLFLLKFMDSRNFGITALEMEVCGSDPFSDSPKVKKLTPAEDVEGVSIWP